MREIKMEIHAYDDIYVESAQNILGHMFDFGINEVGLEPQELVERFLVSDCSKQFEIGNPRFVAGLTGPELARKVLEETGYLKEIPDDVMYIDRSPEYWAGWVMAYLQWCKDASFASLFEAMDIEYVLKLYPTYHEMDISKFIDLAKERYVERFPSTALKRYRELLQMSQRELANESGVPLRQIQMFEQRQRDINKTSAETLLRLSKALHISMEHLMEKFT